MIASTFGSKNSNKRLIGSSGRRRFQLFAHSAVGTKLNTGTVDEERGAKDDEEDDDADADGAVVTDSTGVPTGP